MSALYSPILNIASGWRTTVGNAFQTLRRVAFVVEDTLAWENFELLPTSSMTLTGFTGQHARILKIGKWLSISASFNITTGGVASTFVAFNIPYTFPAMGNQNITGYVSAGAASLIGNISAISGGNQIQCYRSDGANYTLGAVGISFNGIFEVI